MAFEKSHLNIQGSSLIVVLIFLSVIMMVASHSLQSSLLQMKMVNSYHSHLHSFNFANQELIELENELAQGNKDKLSKKIDFVQFVPDTLHFLETKGINYYRLQASHANEDSTTTNLMSVYAIRANENKLNPNLSPQFNFEVPNGCIQSTLVQFKSSANQWYGAMLCEEKMIVYELQKSEIVFELSLPFKEQIEEARLIAIDSKESGDADYLYYADRQGNLVKIDLQNPSPINWFVCYHYQIPGKILQHVIGRAKGEGAIIYLMIEKDNRFWIGAYHDDFQHYPRLLYLIEENPFLSKMLLRHGYLIFATQESAPELKVYDAQRGMLIRKKSFVINNQIYQPFTLFNEPEIRMKKPLEKESEVIIPFKNEEGQCEIEIEYQRLGRKTFEELVF